MNPKVAQVKKALGKNKTALGVAGALVVGLLALRSAKAGGTKTSPATASGAVSTTPGYYSTGGQSAGATGYDSSASDVYNAIQPQLESLGRMLEDAKNVTEAKPPIPVPQGPPPIDPPLSSGVPQFQWGDARRDQIAALYQTILGRAPDTAGLNDWDRTGADITQIRQGILDSNEARARA